MIKIRRASVCMGDDIEDHLIELNIKDYDSYLSLFKYLVESGYLPGVNYPCPNTIWVLNNGKDLIAFRNLDQSFFQYSRSKKISRG